MRFSQVPAWICGVVIVALWIVPAATLHAGADKVAILVGQSDFLMLEDHLDIYAADVEERYDVNLLINPGDWTTAEEVRATLLGLYNSQRITGAILVGRLPYATWYDPGPQPLAIFYEDLDGEFLDIGYTAGTEPGNGVYDYWAPNEPDPVEIWVAFLRPQNNDPDPISSLQHFFDKTHEYYTGHAIYPRRGLIHCHSSYPSAANPESEYHAVLSEIYGDDLFLEGGALRYPYPNLDMLNHLRSGFEIVDPWSHGGCGSHGIHTADIQGLYPPRSLITISWSCSSANFHNCTNNLAIGYVLGNSDDGNGNSAYSDGQVFIGVNRPIGTEGHHIVYEKLADGRYIGDAFMAWLTHMYAEDTIIRDRESRGPWDFVFIGNPFLSLADIRIDTAEPYSIPEGYGGSPLIVKGEGFETGAQVRLNNISDLTSEHHCAITSACSYMIEAQLPPSLRAGTYHVTVTNPGGEGASLVDHFHVITSADSDGDGLSDEGEVENYLTDPFDDDTDKDGLTDGEEVSGLLNVHYGNRPTDPTDPDSDGDNFCSDLDEITGNLYYGYFLTNPCDWDTDNDRLCDGHSDETNPLVPDEEPYDPDTDTDGDGLTEKEENYPYKTFPAFADSDNDGIPDGEERDYWVGRGINPTGDIDRDKQRNIVDRDSDNDGITDGIEIRVIGTDPARDDSDGDGMPDGWEAYYSLSPLEDDSLLDTDEDGTGNLQEYLGGTEPASPPPPPQENTYYVDGQNGTDAYEGRYPNSIGIDGPWKTISHAVSRLRQGDTCWVSASTYFEQLDDFPSDGISLVGDCHGTIWPDSLTRPTIDGENTRSYCILCNKSSCVFKNFETRNATIRNVQFWRLGHDNEAHNIVSHHAGRSGFYCEYGSTDNLISDCVSHSNQYGVRIYGYNELAAAATVRRCSIYGNSVSGVHGVLYQSPASEVIVESCLLYNNTDGISGSWSSLDVVNSTVADNSSYGIRINNDSASGEILNCVITGNSTGILEGSPGLVTDYNDVWGNGSNWLGGASRGAHSISEDPLFMVPGSGDYHLSSGSPCIDTGADSGLADDFEGDRRPQDGDVSGTAEYDIGADEFEAAAVTHTPTPSPPTPTPTPNTPVPPTVTPAGTPVQPTATPTDIPVQPTPTPTDIPVAPTATPTAGQGEGSRLMVMIKERGEDFNLYSYNCPVVGDWTRPDSGARNPSPCARDFWVIPSGNEVIDLAASGGDGEESLHVMKKEGLNDFNLYLYNSPVPGDRVYWDAAGRNPSPLARDLWVVPAGNNTIGIAAIDITGDGPAELAVLKREGRNDMNLYYYNAPVPGDWTYWDAVSRNPSPMARDFWIVPSGNNVVDMTAVTIDDSERALALIKLEGRGDLNLYIYNRLEASDWSFWDSESRNPYPLARDLWRVPAGNDTSGIVSLDINGDGLDELAVLKNKAYGGCALLYYNVPLVGDWTYWDAAARNPSPIARDLWLVPDGSSVAAVGISY